VSSTGGGHRGPERGRALRHDDRFRDRVEAGRALARLLGHLRDERPVVVGLPRGGVVVAAEVADALDAPLDVILVRKLGMPLQPELAMGAIGEGGVRIVNLDIMARARVGREAIRRVEASEQAELAKRAQRFRAALPPVDLAGRTVVIVDDGIATGSTAKVACLVARARRATRVVLAVPVAPADWTARLAGAADEFVSVMTPERFAAIGQFYDDFRQSTDAEVVALLERGAHRADRTAPPPPPADGSAAR